MIYLIILYVFFLNRFIGLFNTSESSAVYHVDLTCFLTIFRAPAVIPGGDVDLQRAHRAGTQGEDSSIQVRSRGAGEGRTADTFLLPFKGIHRDP